ncbi:transcriptional regulator [Amycolatopsis antarctica]|uniref:Transcriptional regulator n=1 Tax=Amycolatopsis antarctica TaxID=1854586 RepID=A0A263D8P7_9PSEU|nr:helix-turn-helix domain-containing protein [Amycolatopsis antarctica]OZM73765.1 transcriptional regulator [Amycolatopsis antarctica]
MDEGLPAFSVGGRPLHERLTAELPRLASMVVAELTERVPAYRLLPGEQLAGDITRVIEANLRSFISVLRSRTLPGQAELDVLRESAARRAEEGIPIDVVLTAYHVGVQVVWESVAPLVRPDEVGDLIGINALAMRYLEMVAPAVGAGYLDERQTMFDDERSARHILMAALLGGTPPETAAERAGLRLPPGYLVLAIAVGAHPDETRADIDPVVAARRKLRRLRAELDRRARVPVLSALAPEGGTALLPTTVAPEELSERDWDGLRRIIVEIGQTAGAEVTVGVVAAEPAAVAGAAATAREVLHVAQTFGRPPGVHRLRDVLLEYQLSRPSEAIDELAALLRPLDGNEELVQTLETFLRRGGRRPTATELHVHPNTVDYRLRKIEELTGFDATALGGAATVTAALIARRLRRDPAD